MSGPITDMPVNMCKYCGHIWVADEEMQEDTERCPRCGKYPSTMVIEEDDRFAFIGEGTSKFRRIIYTETAGPLITEDGKWLITEQRI